MIKFFRKIRQQLLSQNRFSKYILYAIGEIVLVVIGILIALNINNNNIKNQQEKKIVSLLETILNDLSSDIENCNEALEFEIEQDSILTLIIEDKLTVESYNNLDYSQYVSYAISVEIADNGYTNLIDAVNEIPEQFKEAYKTLSILHSEHKPIVNQVNELVLDFVLEVDKKWAATHPWYSKNILNNFQNRYEPIPEMVQYFLNDTFYKNDAASLYTLIKNHMDAIQKYKHQAIKSYYAIHNVLEKTIELPEFISSHMNYLSSDDSLKFEGSYFLKDSGAIKVEITYEDGGLNWTQFGGNAGNKGSTTQIFTKSELEFFEVSAVPIRVFFEENDSGQIIGFRGTLGEQEYYFEKSDMTKN